MDFWSVHEFADFYSRPDDTEPVLESVLLDAQETIENYVTAAAYASALAGDAYSRTFKRVMGQLALFYLAQRPNTSGLLQVKNASKSYSGVKTYSESYGNTAFLRETTTEAELLVPLSLWKDSSVLSTTGTLTTAYGTGRFMSAELEFEEDEDV